MAPDGTKTAKRSTEESDLDLLRQILVGTNVLEVREVKERIVDPERRARDVGEVLARAIVIRSQEDGQLAAAMRPTIESTLSDSVRKNPQAIVDVIFPIIGPAIRKAISQSMASMVGSINRTVESAFTFRGLKWRIQAWRKGKSYGEVALSHNLVYRVEQLFLIHRGSGLLIEHVVNTETEADEPEVVSGMLTAIRDFVHDSFDVDEGSALDTFRVGDLNLLIEQGSQAVLAAVVRGIPPPELRGKLIEAIETVHADYQVPLASFDGDPGEFAGVDAVLETCLGEQKKEAKQRTVSSFLFWTAIFGGIIALVSWWVIATTAAAERADSWNAYLERLRSEPGIVVTWASDPEGTLRAQGLRDPMAREPLGLLDDIELPEDEIELTFEPYHASHEPFVAKRLEAALRPFPTTKMELRDGTLHVSGQAPVAWIEALRQAAPLAAGVSALDLSGLTGLRTLDVVAELKDGLEAVMWTSPTKAELEQTAKDVFMPKLRELVAAAERAQLDVRVRVLVVGGAEMETAVGQKLFEYLKRRNQPVAGSYRAEERPGGSDSSMSAPTSSGIRLACELRQRAGGSDADK